MPSGSASLQHLEAIAVVVVGLAWRTLERCRGFPVSCYWCFLESHLVKVRRQAGCTRATVGETKNAIRTYVVWNGDRWNGFSTLLLKLWLCGFCLLATSRFCVTIYQVIKAKILNGIQNEIIASYVHSYICT